jgi:hypothetical protein
MTTMEADAQHSWRLNTIVASFYDSDGWLGIQPDADGTEVGGLSSGADATPEIPGGGVPDYEMITPLGLWARPVDPVTDANGNPDAANAGLMLTLYEGGRGYSIPLTDPRATPSLPPLAKGDMCLYAPGCPTAGVIVRGYGSTQGQVSIVTTTDGTPGGQTVSVQCWPTGHARTGPWGGESFDANGWHIWAHDNSWGISTGGVGGLPGPASQFDSYMRLTSAGILLNASSVVLGVPGPLGSYPVLVMNPQTIALFKAILAAFNALEAQVASLTGSTGPVTSPLTAGAVTAISTLAAIEPELACVSSSAAA